MKYDSWIQFVFGTSLAVKNTPAHADAASSIPKSDVVQFITRAFTNCGTDLAQFSDVQAAGGLEFIAWGGESDWMYYIYEESLEWPVRAACIRSIACIYRDCFARRCEESSGQDTPEANAIDVTCYMWWDRFPGGAAGARDDEEERVATVVIDVMSEAILVSHSACWRSVLHGLGHWATSDPVRVRRIIDEWLASTSGISLPLMDYARRARDGNVQ